MPSETPSQRTWPLWLPLLLGDRTEVSVSASPRQGTKGTNRPFRAPRNPLVGQKCATNQLCTSGMCSAGTVR